MRFLGQPVAVDPDDHRLARVDLGRARRGGFLDALLGQALGDRLGHPAMRLDLVDQRLRFFFQLAGQRLDIPAPAERIGDRGHPAFLGQDQLGVARDPRREIGRQRDRLVEAVGVQRLRPAKHRRQRLDRGADDIVVRVLLGQRHAAGLAMRAQQLRLLRLGAKVAHDPRPQGARRAQLGDLHEQVHADAEEEAQARRESVDVEPVGLRRRAHIPCRRRACRQAPAPPSPRPRACDSR